MRSRAVEQAAFIVAIAAAILTVLSQGASAAQSTTVVYAVYDGQSRAAEAFADAGQLRRRHRAV
jgi:hypothetical protein